MGHGVALVSSLYLGQSHNPFFLVTCDLTLRDATPNTCLALGESPRNTWHFRYSQVREITIYPDRMS